MFMISNNNFWSRDKLGQNSNTARADVTVVPYSKITTLTSDEAKTHLFPEYPVRYYVTLCSTSPTHDVNTFSHSVLMHGSSCSASPVLSTSSPS